MKVFAPGAYMWQNKGDAALVLSFLPWLREEFGAEEIVLTSFVPESDSARYGVETLAMVTRPHTFAKRAAARLAGTWSWSRRLLSLWRVLSVHTTMRALDLWARLYLRHRAIARRIAPKHVVQVADAIERADAVITVPGGYLLAARPTDDWWLYHLPTLRLVKRLGKRVILGPCSVGPFAGLQRRVARSALDLIDVFLLREDRSVALVRELGVDPGRIIRTPDMAFRFVAPDDSADVRRLVGDLPSDVPLLGISVRSHHYPGHADPQAMERRYLEAVRDAVLRVCEIDRAFPVIVPQTTMDAPISARLSRMLESSGCAHRLASDALSPAELQAVYARLRLMIGTRMHANILALNVGTPVVGIAYEPKTLGILDDLGLSEWGIRIDEVDDGRLTRRVEAQWVTAEAHRDVALDRTAEARSRLDRVAGELTAALGQEVPA